MWNCRVGLVLVIILTAAMAWAQAPLTTPSSDAEIRQILADRVDKQRQSVGIVVGMLEPAARRIVTYGSPAKSDPRRRPIGTSRNCATSIPR